MKADALALSIACADREPERAVGHIECACGTARIDRRVCAVDESKLLQKLRDLEALFAGATTDGERVAAGTARERILVRLHELERSDPPVEYRFTLADGWSKRLFLALLRRYELKPYRYRSQRRTTVMVRVPKGPRRCGRTFSARTRS